MPSKTNKQLEPIFVPAEHVAKALNLSTSRIIQLAREEVLPKASGNGQWDLIACTSAYVKHLKEGTRESKDYWTEKTRLTKAQADEKESILKQRERELIPFDEIYQFIARLINSSRAKLLAIPNRIAPEVAIEQNPNICKQLIEDCIYEALEELSRLEEFEKGEGDNKSQQ